jgi:hypothetical protein
MYKLIPMFLFAFGFAETAEVYYTTDTPIAGFQFNVLGIDVTDAGGGVAETSGFTVSTGNNTVLGFSFDGSTIPVGKGILLVLDLDGNTDNICLTDLIISDSDGQGLDVTVEDCNTIAISEDDIIIVLQFSTSVYRGCPYSPEITRLFRQIELMSSSTSKITRTPSPAGMKVPTKLNPKTVVELLEIMKS